MKGVSHERDQGLRYSIELMNHLLASPARPQAVYLLRRILHERSSARVKRGRDKNSLPGLF